MGLSIVHAFAAAGVARIAIVSRSAESQTSAKEELSATYPTVEFCFFQASITDHGRMRSILRELSAIDVLVLCPSYVHPRMPACNLDTSDVQESFDTNVVATFDLVSAYCALPDPPAEGNRGTKTVLNISSAAAQAQGAQRAAYGTSKAAAVQMMQHFAAEQAHESVAAPIVNGDHGPTEKSKPATKLKIVSFHPGTFYTPTVAAVYSRDQFAWDDLRLPADFALWLAGPESDFLHGRYVWAHWDVDELVALKEKVLSGPNFLTFGLVM